MVWIQEVPTPADTTLQQAAEHFGDRTDVRIVSLGER